MPLRVDKENYKRRHRMEGVQSKSDAPHTGSSVYFFL